MNRVKKLLAVLVCAAMALALVPGVAMAEKTADGLVYELLYSGYVEITGYTGEPAVLDIPAEIEGRSVTTISAGAFRDCTSLTSVTIPYSVTSIGYDAFDGCDSLTEISVNEKMRIIKVKMELCSTRKPLC